MYQIQFRLGLRPRPGGAYSAPPYPLAGVKGPTSKGRGGEGKGWERVKDGRGRGGKEGKGEGGAPSDGRAEGPETR